MTGHRLYKIETVLKDKPADNYTVNRRYNDLHWLHSELCLTYLGCVVPPIPPKINLSTYKGDDNQEMKERKRGFEAFLSKVVQHPKLCASEDLKGFLTEIDSMFEKRKSNSEHAKVKTEEGGKLASVYSYISSAGSALGGFIWKTQEQEDSKYIPSQDD